MSFSRRRRESQDEARYQCSAHRTYTTHESYTSDVPCAGNQYLLIPKLQADIQTLRPEARLIFKLDWISHLRCRVVGAQAAHLPGIDAVDEIAGAQHIADVQEVVTERDTHIVKDLIADVERK